MATLHRETERKYTGALTGPLRADDLPGVAELAPAEPEHLDAVYYDTADLRLLGQGITLRRRTGGRDAGWHLKLPAADDTRTEVRLPPEAGTARQVPDELAQRVRVHTRGAELLAVVHLHTRRTPTLLLDRRGRTLAELAVDEVSAQLLETQPSPTAGGATAPGHGSRTEVTSWSETEVELVGGRAALLNAVERQLTAQGLRPSPMPSKLAHALAHRRPDGSAPTALRPASVGEALADYLRRHTAELIALDAAVRADEPDAVHQMRVCVRRLRSALTTYGRLLHRRRTDPLAAELRWLGQVLGKARDAEVMGERLSSQARALPPPAQPEALVRRIERWFGHRYRYSHQRVLRTLDERRYFGLLDALEEVAARPPLRKRARRAGGGPAEAARTLRRERGRTGRRMREALGSTPGPDRDHALHQARKAAKRARYAAECARPLVASAGRYAKRMQQVQQALGRHQDAVVAEQELLSLAAQTRGNTEEAFGYGVLYGVQRLHVEEDVAAAEHAWRRSRRV